MKPSDAEIHFAKLRQRIQSTICTCFSTGEICLDLDFVSGGGNVDSVVGSLQGHTLAGQLLIQDRTYRGRNTGNETKIEAAIGHTGEWVAIVTITTSHSDPIQVVYDREEGEADSELISLLAGKMKEIQ